MSTHRPMSTRVNQCRPDAERPTCNVNPPLLHLHLNKWSIIFGRLFWKRERVEHPTFNFKFLLHIQLYTWEKVPIFEKLQLCWLQWSASKQGPVWSSWEDHLPSGFNSQETCGVFNDQNDNRKELSEAQLGILAFLPTRLTPQNKTRPAPQNKSEKKQISRSYRLHGTGIEY